ncbi:hypothetical protein ACI7YT_12495 [Microbacterium sp. M]|uniref:hypothetical protein n=1 Tax=Microbacterium sp. M TaxID=3377125 RepID=UPI00386BDFFE
MSTKTATFRRYVNDPSTTERELHRRSGQRVIARPLNPEEYDAEEVGAMYEIEFPDGRDDVAFAEELTDWSEA